MKTKNTILAFSLGLMLIGLVASNVYSGSLGQEPQPVSAKKITYVVHINSGALNNLNCAFYVEITDASGRLIANPQVYQPGVYSYTFVESNGKIKEARVARMIMDWHAVTDKPKVTIPPELLPGPFFPGMTYGFELTPLIWAPVEPASWN